MPDFDLKFESHQGCVVSLSKTLHLHCLVLAQPRKRPDIVDWDVKPQPKQNKTPKTENRAAPVFSFCFFFLFFVKYVSISTIVCLIS